MSEPAIPLRPKGKRRVILWVLLTVSAVVVLVPLAALGLLWSGGADGWARRAVIEQVGNLTGGTVDLGSIRLDPLALRLALHDFTIHGREPAGTPPFFHADQLDVAVSIDNFWSHKISLRNLEVTRPSIHIRFEKDGSSNAPAPRPPATAQSATPLRQRLFTLAVRRLRLVDGEMLFNGVRIPLVAEGDRFDFALDYSAPNGVPAFLGDLRWQQFQVALRRYIPFRSDISVRFQVEQNSFSVTQLVWNLPHTSLDAQLSVANFAQPDLTFRYRGHLDLQDIREILRQPTTPDGRVDFTGQGNYSAGRFALDGGYTGEGIALHFQWFHAGGFTSRGSYHANNDGLTVPDFSATALGGSTTGKVQLTFPNLAFRTETRTSGVSLQAALAAVNNPGFPVSPLHWAGAVDVDAVTSWTADFHNLDSQGVSFWAPPSELQPGQIPATAHITYHYRMANDTVTLAPSEISTPSSRLQMSGTLGRVDSAMDETFETEDLVPWNDFINRLRGEDAEPKHIGGKAHWQGRITGPLGDPTFSGHVQGTGARYETLLWDTVEGDLTYRSNGFRFEHATATRGPSSAQFDSSLELNEWSFDPDSTWNLDATLVRTDTDGLQALAGWTYPAHGLLSGTFHGSGTHANPQLQGLFDVVEPRAWGWKFDRARGQITLNDAQIRIANAELRLPPPPPANGQPAAAQGLLTGNFMYGTSDSQVSFDLTGAVLPLEGISLIQTSRLPIGGQLSFQLKGNGPLRAPQIDGALRLVNLRLGSEVWGSFQSQITSDGKQLALTVDSDASTGEVHGRTQITLGGDYPITGQIALRQVDPDAFLAAALRLESQTGHSSVDGEFTWSGALLHPETIQVDANLTRLAINYAYVSLENTGPVRLQYRAKEVRIQSATLNGTDTNLELSGSASFAGDHALNLRANGGMNLRLLSVFAPKMDAQGPARVDAGIAGTFDSPRVTGQVEIQDASFRYGDFPAGLSHVKGDLIFDTTRMVFDNLTAESGGGQLSVNGILTYGNGPLRYDVAVRSDRVRIRYPVGLSWLAGGTLRLSGNSTAATLSGRVTVERLLMAENFNLGSLVGGSSQSLSGPTTNSPFLRNLQFDIQADLAPNARFEWASASFQTEASMQVRGTWEHPILLGHLHLLNGSMDFRGNRYQLSRGDVNFANPFRLDPLVAIEASTTIRQYAVTVNFNGPASHLTMSYRSDPPLPSSDIIALLALGQTGEESQLRGTGQTPSSGATTLLSEAISSQLGGRVQRLFGISHFSVDPAMSNTATTGSENMPRVTVSQQVSQNLIVTYVTNVTSTQQQIIQIEYAVRKDLSIVALRDENGTFGIDVVRTARFK